MVSGAFLAINTILARQVYTYLNAAPVPDVSSKEHHEPCVHFDVNAAGEGHWYRRRLSQVQRVFR